MNLVYDVRRILCYSVRLSVTLSSLWLGADLGWPYFFKVTLFWLIQSEIVCSRSHFIRSCLTGELLVIHSAQFGFLYDGTCNISFDELNPEGCRNDIGNRITRACAGKESCRYPPEENIPSKSMYEENTECVGTSTLNNMYMEVDYGCYPTIGTDNDCVMSGSEATVRVILAKNLQRSRCILKIAVKIGQIIEMTVYGVLPGKQRLQYGTVSEPELKDQQSLVDGIKYTSKSSQFWINISDFGTTDLLILQYEVIGCPHDINLPSGAVVIQQTNSFARIGCKPTYDSKTWTLQCINNEWQDDGKNCTEVQSQNTWLIPISVVSGAALILLAAISVLVGYLRSRSRRKRRRALSEEQSMVPYSSGSTRNTFGSQLNDASSTDDGTEEPVYPPPPRQSYLALMMAGYAGQDSNDNDELEDSFLQLPPLPLCQPSPRRRSSPLPPLPEETQYSMATLSRKSGCENVRKSSCEDPRYYSVQ